MLFFHLSFLFPFFSSNYVFCLFQESILSLIHRSLSFHFLLFLYCFSLFLFFHFLIHLFFTSSSLLLFSFCCLRVAYAPLRGLLVAILWCVPLCCVSVVCDLISFCACAVVCCAYVCVFCITPERGSCLVLGFSPVLRCCKMLLVFLGCVLSCLNSNTFPKRQCCVVCCVHSPVYYWVLLAGAWV